jgi:hypothetical protein
MHLAAAHGNTKHFAHTIQVSTKWMCCEKKHGFVNTGLWLCIPSGASCIASNKTELVWDGAGMGNSKIVPQQ